MQLGLVGAIADAWSESDHPPESYRYLGDCTGKLEVADKQLQQKRRR